MTYFGTNLEQESVLTFIRTIDSHGYGGINCLRAIDENIWYCFWVCRGNSIIIKLEYQSTYMRKIYSITYISQSLSNTKRKYSYLVNKNKTDDTEVKAMNPQRMDKWEVLREDGPSSISYNERHQFTMPNSRNFFYIPCVSIQTYTL